MVLRCLIHSLNNWRNIVYFLLVPLYLQPPNPRLTYWEKAPLSHWQEQPLERQCGFWALFTSERKFWWTVLWGQLWDIHQELPSTGDYGFWKAWLDPFLPHPFHTKTLRSVSCYPLHLAGLISFFSPPKPGDSFVGQKYGEQLQGLASAKTNTTLLCWLLCCLEKYFSFFLQEIWNFNLPQKYIL